MASNLKPDVEAMADHLEHLFGGDLGGHHEGMIEIAWTDPYGALSHAKLFDTSCLEEAAEFAAEKNVVEGTNTYVGAALRQPSTPTTKRCSDGDVLALPAYYADLDEPGAHKRATAKYEELEVPPTCVVVTGRKPHKRAQMWWKLDSPNTDPTSMRAVNSAIGAALGGDLAVVNPGRVMRLGGSIAWAVKDGRVDEHTKLILFDDRPRSYLAEHLARVFKSAPAAARKDDAGKNGIVRDGLARVIDGRETHAVKCVAAAIGDLIRGLERLPSAEETFEKAWPFYSNTTATRDPGKSLEEEGRGETLLRQRIAHLLQRATSGDWPVLEDIQQEMIDAAFVAGIENVGNSRVQIPNLDAKPFDSAAAVRTPRRPWVFGTLLLRRYVSALIAPPGAGKTNFGIHTGIALATGREWAGMQPHDPGPVWIINAEEDLEELNRRVLAAAIHMGVDPADLDDRLFVNSGADREIQLARENPKTREIDSLPDVETIINVIRQRGIRLLILDPLAEFHTAPEGNNDAMKIVAKLCRQIAQRADCAVLLAHHPRKSPAGDADGHAGNMDSARGASALVGVTRVVSTLLGMSKKEADRLGIADEDRRLYVRLDDAKANMSLITSRAKWFRRESVELSNAPLGLDGDVVGVLEPVDLHNLETAAETHAKTQDERIARAVLGLVEDGKKTTSGLAETLIQTDSNFFEWRPSTLAERIKQVCQPHRAVNGFILKYVHQQAGNGRHWIMAENYENA